MSCARSQTTLRTLIACLAAALVAVAAGLPTAADASSRLDRTERRIMDRFNSIRAGAGLPALKPDRALTRSADFHSKDMLAANFFAHASSNGDSMAKRVGAFRPSKVIGEVLAYVPGTRRRGQAGRVVRMWMGSPGHRASILTRDFRRVGVSRRTGRFGNTRVTVFTADLTSAR